MKISIGNNPAVTLYLGRQGENNVKEILFDLSYLKQEFGDGSVSLVMQRPTDYEPYPIALDIVDGSAVWTVSNVDTSVDGIGKAQVTYIVDEQIKKSVIYKTKVLPSLKPESETPPDAFDNWLDTLGDLSGQISADKAQALIDIETARVNSLDDIESDRVNAIADVQGAGNTAKDEVLQTKTQSLEAISQAQSSALNSISEGRVSALQDIEVQGGEAVRSAQQYAQAASESAQSASDYAEDAQGYAEEVSDLKSALNDIGTKTANIFNPESTKDGYTIYSGGSEGTNPNNYISGFIWVKDIPTLYFYPAASSYIGRIVFYNSQNINDISEITSANAQTKSVTNSNNAPYMRFVGNMNSKSQVCVSASPLTEYIPYGYEKAVTTEILPSEVENYVKLPSENNGLLYLNDWANRIYYTGQGIWGNTQTRIGTQNTHTTALDLLMSVENGYQIAAVFFNSDTPSAEAEISHTPWSTSIRLPKGTPFTVNCRKSDDSTISATDGFNPYITILPYDSNVIATNFVKGAKIDLTYQGYTFDRVGGDLPAPSDIASGLTARQDFAMYGGVMFQLYSPDYIALIDPVTGSAFASFSINCGHGNSCQFGSKFYADGDSYPLLYCFGYTDDFVYVNRVTDSSSTLVRKYKLNTDGYRFSGGLDKENNQLMSIHYKLDSSTVGTGNSCIVTVWDLNDVTVDDGGNYVPAIVKQREIPFLPIIQGCEVFKGKLYVISGQNPTYNVPVKINAFDRDGEKVSVIDDFPSLIANSEGEGISFWIDGNKYKCYFTTLFLYELFV